MTDMRSDSDNWRESLIGDEVDFTRKPRDLDIPNDYEIPFIPMDLLPDEGLYTKNWELRRADKIASGVFFKEGDLLLAKITPCLENGKQGIAKGIPGGWGFATTEVFPIKPHRLETEFLAFFLKSSEVRQALANKMQGATGRQRLPREALESYPIVVPPLPEQKAIAHVLRTVQQAKEATEKVIAATRQLKQSLMKHLFTYGPVPFGQADKVELKETEIGPIPEHWKVERLDDHWSSMLGKMLSPKARSGNSPRPYLRNANVQWGRIDLADLFEMDFKEGDYERYGLVPGDVLTCEGGEVGRTAIWRGELKECYYQKALHRLRPRSNQMIPEFLLYHMMHAFLIRGCYGEVGTVTTIAHLPGVKLKALPIPVPPIAEQKQIIALLNGVEKKADTEELYLNSLSTNFGSLLHHLMTGKIRVPIETNQITAEAI